MIRKYRFCNVILAMLSLITWKSLWHVAGFSLRGAGSQREPGNSSLPASQAGSWGLFLLPFTATLLLFLSSSLVSWQRVQQKSFGKGNLWVSCYITHTKPKEAQSSLSLSLGGLLYFLLMDSLKWQTCTHWHDFSFNMIQGSCGNFDLRGCVILRYRQTHVNLKLYGQHQCWQHL